MKAVALVIGVIIIILTILHQFNPGMNILTGIGIFALSLAMLSKEG